MLLFGPSVGGGSEWGEGVDGVAEQTMTAISLVKGLPQMTGNAHQQSILLVQ